MIDVEVDGASFDTFSIGGDLASSGAPYLSLLLQHVGATAEDLTTAAAADSSGSTRALVFAVRIQGIEAPEVMQGFLDVTSNGDAVERMVEGRTVRQVAGGGSLTYILSVDDVMVIVQAQDEALAAEVLTALP